MNWINRNDEKPPLNIRIAVYSPEYEAINQNHVMTYRIIDSQFLEMCTDVTHFAYLKPPFNKDKL